MSYYDSSDNKIRRKKISSSNSNKIHKQENIVNPENKQEINRINRNEIDEDFELEKELFYKKEIKKDDKHIV